MKPNITILIRHTEGRGRLFDKCLDSIRKQNYKNLCVYVTYDFDIKECDKIDRLIQSNGYSVPIFWRRVEKQKSKFGYNLYCNDLIVSAQNTNSWYFFLDDDDTLLPGALDNISIHLSVCDIQTPVICQFKRGSRLKPSTEEIKNKQIVSGRIGMPCIFIHSHFNHMVKFTDTSNADYSFIKNISQISKPMFVTIPVVYSDRRSHGK